MNQNAEMPRRTFFSIDGENFNHDNAGEALQALHDGDRLTVGSKYEEAVFEQVDPVCAIDADDILERADEYLADNGMLGEDQCYFSEFSKLASAELSELLYAWHEKHKPQTTLWRAVGKSITHAVTEEDVAETAALEQQQTSAGGES